MDDAATRKLSPGHSGGPPPAPRLIPDYELIRAIGKGSYGEVWLVRSVTGMYRAAKIVSRSSFDDSRPFDREYKGLLNYEPVSRLHQSQVDVLHVGKNEEAGCFYYVMELADDVHRGTDIDPNTYKPRTLHGDIARQGRLPLADCLRIGIALAKALSDLHGHGLTHRDIKPSNIVFIRGEPKLVDVGLVTDLHVEQTFVGTAGFTAPEGPGEPNADIYSLGKVLYEIAFGRDRKEFPELPADLRSWTESKDLLELNAVLLKACHHDPKQRYSRADEILADLQLLLAGGSVARKMAMRRRRVAVMKLGTLGAAVALLAVGITAQRRHARESDRQRLMDDIVLKGNRFLAEGDPGAALLCFGESVRLSKPASPEAVLNRIRFAATLAQCPRMENETAVAGMLRTACLHPNGWMMAGAGDDGTIILWNTSTQEPLPQTLVHGSRVLTMSFNPDGNRLLTCGVDGAARLWNVDSGYQLALEIQHGEPIWSVAFSKDGSLFATGGGPESSSAPVGSARLWDAKTGAPVSPLLRHNGRVGTMAFTDDGKALLTGSHDRGVRRWSVSGGEPTGRVILTDAPVRWLEFLSGRNEIVVATYDGLVRFWNCETGEPFNSRLERNTAVWRAGFMPGTGWLALSSEDGTFSLHDPSTGRPALLPFRMPSAVLDTWWSADGKTLRAVHRDGAIRTWTMPDHLCQRIGTGGPVQCIGFDASNASAVVATGHGAKNWSIALHDLRTGEKRREFIHDSAPVLYVANSPDGNRIVATSIDGVARLWDAQDGTAISAPLAHSGPVWEAAFSPDGTRVATASGEDGPGEARIFSATDGQDTGIRLRHDSPVRCVAFSPDGTVVATGGGTEAAAGHARMWDARTGTNRCDSLKHAGSVLHVSFDATGGLLATSSMDHTARLWDTRTGAPIGSPMKHNAGVRHVRFSRDSTRLVTASFDRTARIWDTRTCTPQTPPLKHEGAVIDAQFSPDGEWVVTAAADGATRVWNVRNGQPLTPILPHYGPVTGIAFIGYDNGNITLATGSLDGHIRLWPLRPAVETPEKLDSIARSISGRTLKQLN